MFTLTPRKWVQWCCAERSVHIGSIPCQIGGILYHFITVIRVSVGIGVYVVQCEQIIMAHYRLQTKLRKGNVFTSVGQKFCPRGGGILAGGAYVAEACMVGGCVAGGGMCGKGYIWQWGHAWQERRSLQQMVRILLEYILVHTESNIDFEKLQ